MDRTALNGTFDWQGESPVLAAAAERRWQKENLAKEKQMEKDLSNLREAQAAQRLTRLREKVHGDPSGGDGDGDADDEVARVTRQAAQYKPRDGLTRRFGTVSLALEEKIDTSVAASTPPPYAASWSGEPRYGDMQRRRLSFGKSKRSNEEIEAEDADTVSRLSLRDGGEGLAVGTETTVIVPTIGSPYRVASRNTNPSGR